MEQEIIGLGKRLSNADTNEILRLESDDIESIKHLHRYDREDDIAAASDMKVQSWSMDDIRVRMLRADVGLITYRGSAAMALQRRFLLCCPGASKRLGG